MTWLASALPFALSEKLLPRQFIVYGHLVTGPGHFVSAFYRYPSLGEFDEFIRRFRNAGYEFVSLAQYLHDDNKKKILVTFDDGFKSIYHDLHPYLQREQIPYVLFVLTDPLTDPGFYIGTIQPPPGKYPGEWFLSEQEILDLKNDGVHIGFHTRAHHKVIASDAVEDPRVAGQLTIPDAYRHLFSKPLCFAYPYLAPENYQRFDRWMNEHGGYDFFFDTKGFRAPDKNHFFRVSIDVEKSVSGKNWMVFAVNRQILSSLFSKYFKRNAA